MTGDNTLIHSHGINRRDFMKLCAALAATMGLSSKAAAEMAESVTNPQRPPVIWIGAQECTGCTESLLRATHPTVENLVLETISLEYHEVLSAAFGHQVEENKHNALEKYKGQYVLVVDGSIPLKDNGIYCMVAGEPIVDHIRKAAEGAAAIIAIGSCSAWGGVAAAGVNPTGAVSLQEVLPGKTVINIPGCPPTPAATLYGFAMALGLLEQKIHARGPGELDEQPAEILHGDMVQPLRVKVDREARRLAGYRYGRQIADDFLTQLGQGEEQVARWLEAENDPRLNEIVSHLNHVVEEARIR